MDVQAVVKLADELVFSKTGKHLEYLEEAILRGAIQDQKYSQIAEEFHLSEGHIRDVACKLWKILSDVLDENVSKANVRYILKKGNSYHVSSAIGRSFVGINNVNICPEMARSPTEPQNTEPTPTQPHIDLGDAPEIFNFYSRTPQLSTLETWILQEQSRLIALLGISGIGKTTLALRLIEQIKTNFNYVIYRSLRFSPTLNATLTNLLQIFSDKTDIPQNIETKISQLLDNLRKYRCLIILDDVQMLFSSRQLAGQYQTGSEDYQLFFKLIAEVCHNSSSILISWEKPREIAQLEKANNYVHSLVLGGLGIAAKEILKQQKLSDEDVWETLIHNYQGHPLWLELTTTIIQDLFGGRVSEFLQCDTAILSESLQAQLDQQFQRLTQQELAIMIQLAKENEPVSLQQIIKTVQLSTADLLNAMQSLGMRLFLDAEEQGKTTFFSLNLVMKQYVKNRYFQRNDKNPVLPDGDIQLG